MASDSKAKFLRDAEKFVLQGKLSQAIGEYLKIIKNDPNDVLTLNTIGDLYLRMGKVSEASKFFAQVGEHYVRNNFLLKAIATYKKILAADPHNLEISLTLASLFAKQGLNIDARNQYLRVAEMCAKEGKTRESLEAFEKVVEMDPSNSSVQIKLAEIHLAEGYKEKAHYYFAGAARAQSKAGDLGAAIGSFRRAMQLIPVNADVMKGFLETAIQLNDVQPAIDQLRKSLVIVPEDLSFLEMLGRAYLAAGDPENALKTFQMVLEKDESKFQYFLSVSKAFLDSGDPDQAVRSLDTIVPVLINRRESEKAVEAFNLILRVNPSHVLALTKLSGIYAATNDEARLLEILDRIVGYYLSRKSPREALEHLEKILEINPESAKHQKMHRQVFEEAFPGSVYRAPRAVTERRGEVLPGFGELERGPSVGAGEESVNPNLIEVDLLLNYGMTEKALALLHSLESQDPGDQDVRIRLVSLYRETKQYKKAAEECMQLVSQNRRLNNAAAAEKWLGEARKLDPEVTEEQPPAEPIALGGGHGFAMTIPGEAAAPSAPSPSEGIEVDLSGDLSEIFFKNAAEVETEEETAATPTPEETAFEQFTQEMPAKLSSETVQEHLQEADFYIRLGFKEEARAKLDEIAKEYPNHPELPVRYRQIGEVQLPSEPTVLEQVETAPQPEPAAKEAGDIFQELNIDRAVDRFVESYASELRPAKPPEPEVAPGPALVQELDLGGELDLDKIAAASPKPGAAGRSDQLSSMFADLLDEMNSLSDQDLAREDFDTHFSLGIAYREMELIEDAIKEFQFAIEGLNPSKYPKEVVQCCGMLSTCFLERGMPRSAIRWCESGLNVAQISPHESMALYYDMGIALSSIGESERALECFSYVHNLDPGYRDVAQRILELSEGTDRHVP